MPRDGIGNDYIAMSVEVLQDFNIIGLFAISCLFVNSRHGKQTLRVIPRSQRKIPPLKRGMLLWGAAATTSAQARDGRGIPAPSRNCDPVTHHSQGFDFTASPRWKGLPIFS